MVLLAPKAKLSIELSKRDFKPGERVTGKVSLIAAKPINVRQFVISLIGEEWVNVSCGSGKHKKGKVDAFILFERYQIIGEEKEFSTGDHEFSFDLPSNAPPTILQKIDTDQNIEENLLKTKDNLGALFDVNLFTRKNIGAGLRWYVNAKLDISLSMDVNAREYIFVY